MNILHMAARYAAKNTGVIGSPICRKFIENCWLAGAKWRHKQLIRRLHGVRKMAAEHEKQTIQKCIDELGTILE